MDAAHILSTRFIGWTEIAQPGPQLGNSFSSSPSLSTSNLPNDSDRKSESHELRSAVEQEFRRMNKNHDRIRTQMLCANAPGKK